MTGLWLCGLRGDLNDLFLFLVSLGHCDPTSSFDFEPFLILLHSPDKRTPHPDFIPVFVEQHRNWYDRDLDKTQPMYFRSQCCSCGMGN